MLSLQAEFSSRTDYRFKIIQARGKKKKKKKSPPASLRAGGQGCAGLGKIIQGTRDYPLDAQESVKTCLTPNENHIGGHLT